MTGDKLQPELHTPEVTLRIPGNWSGPAELIERLPSGFSVSAQGKLMLPKGGELDLNALAADADFPGVFASSCDKPPTPEERQRIENYTINVCLTGPGGSLAAARQLLAGAAAVVQAGGAGVFVDNSGIAHGATDWLTLASDAKGGGVYWAFVNTVGGDGIMYSLGMQILGFRDAIIPFDGDVEFTHRTLHSFLGYTAFSGVTLSEGDVVGDAVLPSFRVHMQPHDRCAENSPTFNPFGQWRLLPLQAELN